MVKYWVAVACRQHVLRGVAAGICQVCHGKPGPLKRMSAGDWIVYYSPTEVFRSRETPVRGFTAIGKLTTRPPYQVQMAPHFRPWRRDVIFVAAKQAAIVPLIEKLSFILDKRCWGFPFRRGCFSVPHADFAIIAAAMGVNL